MLYSYPHSYLKIGIITGTVPELMAVSYFRPLALSLLKKSKLESSIRSHPARPLSVFRNYKGTPGFLETT